MTFRRLITGLLCSAAITTGSAALADDSSPTPRIKPTPPDAAAWALARFERRLDQASKTGDFVGIAVVVVEDGKPTLTWTHGVRRKGKTNPVTPDTAFRLASLSKGFAASLTGLAVAKGDVSWNEPIHKRVSDFKLKTPHATQSVTLEHVLSHRVGLPPNAYDNLAEAKIEPLTILGRLREVEPICPVGDCYSYQNNTFNMVTYVIEDTANTSYAKVLKRTLFEPLGMETASIGLAALKGSGNWAEPHIRTRRKGPWKAVNSRGSYYNLPAAGGVNASIKDMSRWLRAQMGYEPDILPMEVLAELHTPKVESRFETRRQRGLRLRIKKTHYGLGWRIYDYAGHTVINHSGGVQGYMAQIAFVPDEDIGIAILANTRATRGWRILPTFLDLKFGLDDRDWLDLEDQPGTAAQ